ncbi:MAG: ComEA family DNA-binding protein [Bacteroidota bacterium]
MKKDRNGVLVLMVLILLSIAGHFLIERVEVTSRTDHLHMIEAYEMWRKEIKNTPDSMSFFYFNPNTVSAVQLDSLNIPHFVKKNLIRYREAGGKFTCASDLRKIYGMNDSIYKCIEPWMIFPVKAKAEINQEPVADVKPKKGVFDPNTAGAEVLTGFGFNKFQASNIVKYRAKGGRFHAPGDVLKIYGVDSAMFLSVKEYIQLEQTEVENSQEDILVELNSADSLELVKLRGIGPVFAARIIRYRNLLGGFSSSDQLLEVYGFPEETFFQLKESFVVDTLGVKKIRLNFAEYSDLIRHPYLKRNHVETILRYRDRHGPFSSRQQLMNSGLIDSVSYQRIKPYLTCR